MHLSFDPATITTEQAAELLAIQAQFGCSRSMLEKQGMSPGMTGAMVGGGLGLGAGLIGSVMSESRRKKWLRNALLGSLLGAGVGGAVGYGGSLASQIREPSPVQKFMEQLKAELDAVRNGKSTGTALVDRTGNPTANALSQGTAHGVDPSVIEGLRTDTPGQKAMSLVNEYRQQPGTAAASAAGGGALGNLYARARAGQFQSRMTQLRGLNAGEIKTLSNPSVAEAHNLQNTMKQPGAKVRGNSVVTPGPAPATPPIPRRTGGTPAIPAMPGAPAANLPTTTPTAASPIRKPMSQQLRSELQQRFPRSVGMKGTARGAALGLLSTPGIARLLGMSSTPATP